MKQLKIIIFILYPISVFSQTTESNTKIETGNLVPSLNTNLTYANGGTKLQLVNFNTSLDFTAKGKYTVGLGTGLDMQQSDTFNISAIPVYFSFQYVFMPLDANYANIYFHFRPGISLGYSAVANPAIPATQHPTMPGVVSTDVNDFVINDLFYQTGIGYEANSGIHIELVYRNQPSNLINPYRQRNNYVGIALGYRIK